MIIFENKGEIEVAAIATFGVSVKEGENPIGLFGTGLKYALAILLRTGHAVICQSGLIEHQFSLVPMEVRGKQFQAVALDGASMGFTTELGKTWEPWMAYRELYCNAKDEGGKIYSSSDAPGAEIGVTRVIVTGQLITSIHASRSEFVLEDNADFVLGGVEIRCRPSRALFYKGIRITEFQKAAMFTYNVIDALDLTEDRTPNCVYSACSRAARSWLHCPPDQAELLTTALLAPTDVAEGNFDYHGWGEVASEAFLATVSQLQATHLSRINATALKVWREQAKGKFDLKPASLTLLQQKILARACAFCVRAGFQVSDYKITVVDELGGGFMAFAADGKIFISVTVLSQGTKYVARALIEEWAHLRHNYRDSTREFQNWLFDRLINACEEIQGEPL